MTVRFVPVNDRWISLVLMAYSKVANRPTIGLSLPVEIAYILRIALNNALYACVVASFSYSLFINISKLL